MSIHPSALSRAVVLAASECRREPPDAELIGRFVGGDEAAFGWIVRRHGAMVHGVCRRVLRGGPDAEDACQATFFVLARKASSIDGRTLAGWLHGVAYRVALRARASAERRAKYEALAKVAGPLDPAREISLREAAAILDEELAALPEKYRAVLALCCLEGLTRDEAARRLGWSASLVKSRLEEARARLRDRLARRGVDAPAVLALATLRDVTPALGEASGSAVALAEETMRALAAPGLRAGVLGLAITTLFAVGAAVMWPAGEKPAMASPPAPRVDVHGDPLPPGAVARLGTVRFRHGGVWTYSMAFSPDGKRLASAGSDGFVRLWDRETGRQVHRLQERRARFVAFTHDGRHLLTCDRCSVGVWELPSGKTVRRVFGSDGAALAFGRDLTGESLSPDGKVVAAGFDRYLHLAEVPSGTNVGVCEGPAGCKLRGSCFSPDGKRLAALYHDGTVGLFDVASRRLVWTNRDHLTDDKYVRHHKELAFAPDGKTLAVSSGAYQPMRFLDPTTGKELRRTKSKYRPAGPLVFLDSGTKLVSSSWDDATTVWDAATGELSDATLPHIYTSDRALSPDGKTLAAVCGPSVRLWDVEKRWSSPRKVDGGLTVIGIVHTPPG